MDEDVVQHQRQRLAAGREVLNRGETQGQIELVAGPVAQRLDVHLRPIRVHAAQHFRVLAVVPDAQLAVVADGETREECVRPAQDRPLVLLPVALDFAVEDLGGEGDSHVASHLGAQIGEGLLLLRGGVGGAAFVLEASQPLLQLTDVLPQPLDLLGQLLRLALDLVEARSRPVAVDAASPLDEYVDRCPFPGGEELRFDASDVTVERLRLLRPPFGGLQLLQIADARRGEQRLQIVLRSPSLFGKAAQPAAPQFDLGIDAALGLQVVHGSLVIAHQPLSSLGSICSGEVRRAGGDEARHVGAERFDIGFDRRDASSHRLRVLQPGSERR